MYYRNITVIIADQNVEIEAGSLWKLDEDTFILTLVDDDQHITAKHTVEVFKYALKEYNIQLYKSLDLQIIQMTFGDDLVFWSLTGNKEQDFMRFGFKTLLKFNKVEALLKSAGVSRDTLTALDED